MFLLFHEERKERKIINKTKGKRIIKRRLHGGRKRKRVFRWNPLQHRWDSGCLRWSRTGCCAPLSPHLPPFPYPFRTETRSNGVLSFLPSKTSPPPCRSFTSPTLLSAPSATVSGVIGWPCILSLSVTAQACGSSSFRRREKEGRKERVSPLKKNFLSKHSISCAVVTRIFLSDRYTFWRKV